MKDRNAHSRIDFCRIARLLKKGKKSTINCNFSFSPNMSPVRYKKKNPKHLYHLFRESDMLACQFTSTRSKVIPADFIETTRGITVIAKRIKQERTVFFFFFSPLLLVLLPLLLSFKMPKCADPSGKRNSARESGAPLFFYGR